MIKAIPPMVAGGYLVFLFQFGFVLAACCCFFAFVAAIVVLFPQVVFAARVEPPQPVALGDV